MECEVMCNTGTCSITWTLHDCAFSINAFIMPHAAYRVAYSLQAWECISSFQLTSINQRI